MVDKLFKSVFNAMDDSKTLKQVTKAIGLESPQEDPNKPIDKTLCIIHKLKKSFFCEDCLFELCVTCKEKHEKSHAIKFIEESARFVTDKFRENLEELKSRRFKVHEASNLDPT